MDPVFGGSVSWQNGQARPSAVATSTLEIPSHQERQKNGTDSKGDTSAVSICLGLRLECIDVAAKGLLSPASVADYSILCV